jgi:imidazolonepropionase-like amidohydrolase
VQEKSNLTDAICLRKVTLIDGTGSVPRLCDIHIKNGRIAVISEPSTQTSDHGLSLDGCFVTPGLIDCHVHLCMDGRADGGVSQDKSFVVLQMLRHAQACLQAGITSMRDVGGWHGVEFALRDAFENGFWQGPRLALAGKLLSITSSGSHSFEGMYREADGVDEVRKAAREQFKAGADLLKLMASGAVMAKGEKPEATQFSTDEMSAAVDEAKKVGKTVAAHAHAAPAIRNAVEAGVNSIEHGTYLYRDPDLVEKMATQGIFLVPTLKALHDMTIGEGVPSWMQDKAKYILQDHRKSISTAIREGVRIAMGTDAATPFNYHGDNAIELQLLSECGMSASRAIQAATSEAARLLGWHDWAGTIEPGKVADLIVLRKNPLDDLKVFSDSHSLAMVLKDGKIVVKSTGIEYDATHGEYHVCCGLPSDSH